jgi:type 1 glutamine amidotransferase
MIRTFCVIACASLALSAFAAEGGKKKIVFIAGPPSHGFGAHEHYAGCLLLSQRLNWSGLPVTSTVVKEGWPQDETVLDDADAIVIYCDGAGGHLAIPHLDKLGALVNKGVGLGCIHFAVEFPKDKGGPEFLQWIGGYFETFWSINPTWTAEFKQLPTHPVTRGAKPFSAYDEWYYHMRFPKDMKDVIPILTAVPPDNTRGREGQNDDRGGNPEVQKLKGEPEHLMWVTERPAGGRGFGLTGGHEHWNWAQDDYRKVVLNACLWIAHGEVPSSGVPSKTPTVDELLAHQDEPTPANFDKAGMEKNLEALNKKNP